MKGSSARTGVGSTAWIRADKYANPFGIGFGVEVSGTVTYSVQHTFDDPLSTTPVAYNHPFVVGQSVQADGNYAYPVQAIRLTVTAGSGTATLKYIQSTGA